MMRACGSNTPAKPRRNWARNGTRTSRRKSPARIILQSKIPLPPANDLIENSRSLLRQEFVDDGVVIDFTGLEHHGRKIRMVRRIWIVLRLHHDGPAIGIHLAVFALDRAVQKVAAVKLQPRLRGPHFHHPPRGW